MARQCSKLMEFMMLMGRLKSTPRSGWVQRGVQGAESVADHMYRMAAMAFLAGPDTNLNRDRCIKLALVHDMAESIVGDITPADGVSKQEKHKQEKTAMEHIQGLMDPETGQELLELWGEYENQTSDEARFVKDLDKFDMILQAHEYEQSHTTSGKLQEFFDSTQDKFQHPMVKDWVQELYKLREEAGKTSKSTEDKT